MQTQTALVGTDCGVKLDTPAAVYLYLTSIVYPRNTEVYDALGLNDALDDAVLLDFGTCSNDRLEGLEDLTYSLQELRLMCIACSQTFVNAIEIFALEHNFRPP